MLIFFANDGVILRGAQRHFEHELAGLRVSAGCPGGHGRRTHDESGKGKKDDEYAWGNGSV
jgi:hypothetical protein